MFSKLVTMLAAVALFLTACAAVYIPPEPANHTIEISWNHTSSSWYMALNVSPLDANDYTETVGTAHIGNEWSYTSIDMHINVTNSQWTIWAVPTAHGGHVIKHPLTAVWYMATLPAPQACGYAPIGNVNNLTYPADYSWWSDCQRGGYPTFHSVAYGFKVSLNEPVMVYGF